MKQGRHEKTRSVRPHSHEDLGHLHPQTESGTALPRAGEEARGELLSHRYRGSVLQEEKSPGDEGADSCTTT